MTTEIIWADIYTKAVETFGGTTPGQQLEAQILFHFKAHPAATQTAIHKIGDRYVKGVIHSPWPLVLRELERDSDREHHVANIDRERDKAIHLTEIYITNAGLYIPTEDEVLDDAFGPHGRLRNWSDDQELREHILEHWRAQRSRAETAEQATAARVAAINAGRQRAEHPLAEQETWIDETGYLETELPATLLERWPKLTAGDIATLETRAQARLGREVT